MNFTKPIVYNGLTVNTLSPVAGGTPLSGYSLDEFDPSVVDVAAFLDKRAQQDGLDASDVFLGARHLGLIVSVYGSTRGDFWDKTQDLLAAFSPTLALNADTANLGFLALSFYQPTADISTWPTSAYPSGIPLQYFVRPVAPPKYTQRRDEEGGSDDLGLSKQFRIALLAKDPRKYLQTQQSVTITSSTQTGTYRGDYPTFPISSFTITSAGSSAFTLVIAGHTTIIDLSSAAAETLFLDHGARTLKNAGGTSRMQYITSVDYATLSAANSTYRMANTSGISSAVLTYREAFA